MPSQEARAQVRERGRDPVMSGKETPPRFHPERRLELRGQNPHLDQSPEQQKPLKRNATPTIGQDREPDHVLLALVVADRSSLPPIGGAR